MNNIGYEHSGHIYLESNSFKKLFSKYFDNITIDNTDNCDLIIKSPLSGNIWNNLIFIGLVKVEIYNIVNIILNIWKYYHFIQKIQIQFIFHFV